VFYDILVTLLLLMTTQEAAQKLLNGDLVVFPTETVYGLGALASNDTAVQKIFKVKGRPQHNPLILHIANISQLDKLVKDISQTALKLMDHFWPGPLTICFEKSEAVSDLVTADLPTVCVRMPNHPIAQELLKEVGQAIAAPSANLSGKPSTTSFQDALRQLEQDAVSFIDGGDTPIGLESTVIDCHNDTVTLLRPGSISQEEIESVLGQALSSPSENSEIQSPGQLLSHYAPEGNLTVILGEREARREWISNHLRPDLYLGLIGDPGSLEDQFHEIMMMDETNLHEYSRRLYSFLNSCDRKHSQEIYLEMPTEETHPLYQALLNRLKKASNGNIIKP
jgi:L-threonylcarbamoyladenylate synthase